MAGNRLGNTSTLASVAQGTLKRTHIEVIRVLLGSLSHKLPANLARLVLTSPDQQDLQATSGWIFKEFKEIYVVMDALDERPEKNEEREELLDIIKDIHGWSLDSLHVLATSRRELDIEAVLDPLLSTPATCIQNAQIDADIKINVQSELETVSKKKWPNDLRVEIEETLVSGANGM